MKPKAWIATVALILLALGAGGCRRAAPAPSASATPSRVLKRSPVPAGSRTPVPSSFVPTPVARTTAPVRGPGPYVRPERLWGLGYVPNDLVPADLDEQLVVFTGPRGEPLAAVDSFLSSAGDVVGGGGALRLRAVEAAAQVFGSPITVTAVLTPDNGIWQTGIAFAAPGGRSGEAVYAQPGGPEGLFRLYGFLFACSPALAASERPDLAAMRSSLKPVARLPLDAPPGGGLLAMIYSFGLRSFDPSPGTRHFVVLEANDRAIAYDYLEPAEYLAPTSVRQVLVEPRHVWLEVESGFGDHSGCYDLFSFGNGRLVNQVSHCHATPSAAQMADIDGNGTLEVILDTSDASVFCYACGLRYPQLRVMGWQGASFGELRLENLPSSAPTDLWQRYDRALKLAQGGLWKDARTAIESARAMAPDDRTVARSSTLIRLQADALAAQVQEGSYPLLANAFYGDYAATLNIMRSYPVADLWNADTPLVHGTAAEGYEEQLADWMIQVTTQALGAEPDLAAAYFLRGWATHLRSPGSAAALDDVARAAELAPGEPLFARSLALLQGP